MRFWSFWRKAGTFCWYESLEESWARVGSLGAILGGRVKVGVQEAR
jgi:hypothetical protein